MHISTNIFWHYNTEFVKQITKYLFTNLFTISYRKHKENKRVTITFKCYEEERHCVCSSKITDLSLPEFVHVRGTNNQICVHSSNAIQGFLYVCLNCHWRFSLLSCLNGHSGSTEYLLASIPWCFCLHCLVSKAPSPKLVAYCFNPDIKKHFLLVKLINSKFSLLNQQL